MRKNILFKWWFAKIWPWLSYKSVRQQRPLTAWVMFGMRWQTTVKCFIACVWKLVSGLALRLSSSLTSCGTPPPALKWHTNLICFFFFCFFWSENDRDSLFSQGVIRLTQMTHPLHQTNCPFSHAADAEGFVRNPRDIKDKHRLLIPPYPLSL